MAGLFFQDEYLRIHPEPQPFSAPAGRLVSFLEHKKICNCRNYCQNKNLIYIFPVQFKNLIKKSTCYNSGTNLILILSLQKYIVPFWENQ